MRPGDQPLEDVSHFLTLTVPLSHSLTVPLSHEPGGRGAGPGRITFGLLLYLMILFDAEHTFPKPYPPMTNRQVVISSLEPLNPETSRRTLKP